MIRLIHNLTHHHTFGNKDGVGEFLSCGWRFFPNVHVLYRPDLADAGWHEVADIDTMRRMLAADDALAAMAMLRASQ
jgi:hypothetical protein